MTHHSVWGPAGIIVEQVVRRAATLTTDERARLGEAWRNESDEVDEAWGRVSYAGAKTGRRLWAVGGDAARVFVDGADGAVRDAAAAAAVSDLVGAYGLTAAHVDALMGPWVEVVGDPRTSPVCRCEQGPVTVDLGSLAPQPGDRYPWLVMDAASPEPLIVGYAPDAAAALEVADGVDGPAILWRAGKKTP